MAPDLQPGCMQAQTSRLDSKGIEACGGQTCSRVLTTSRPFVRVAEDKPASNAETVCTAMTSPEAWGTRSGLAPRHLSTCAHRTAALLQRLAVQTRGV